MPTYGSVLTVIGAAQIANSQITGVAPVWTAMGVGDGGGHVVTPSAARTALVREVYRGQINTLYRPGDDETQIVAELVIQPQTGGWTLREVGIYDADGNLVVYGSLPEMVKPVLAEGSGITAVIRARVAVGSNGNVTLKIDPSIVIATRKYVNDMLTAHSLATGAHPLATASIPGFMSPGDKETFDKTFKGVAAGGKTLHATPEHPNLRLNAESPVYFEADESTGKITAKVRASVAAAAGTMPIADATGLLAPGWGALPPGWVGFFAAASAPDGFLVCNGAQNLSRVTYARLFGAVGTRFGAGDGATTFGIPDLRGKFLRGYLAGVTKALGAPQSDAIRNILGAFTLRSTTSGVWPDIVASAQGAFALSSGAWSANTVTVSTATSDGRVVAFDASRSVPTAAENRPANVALLPCIKY